MTPRDDILRDVRTALRRTAGQAAGSPPPVRSLVPALDREERIRRFCEAVAALDGTTHRAASGADACAYVSALLGGGAAVASNAPILGTCGITALPGVHAGSDAENLLRSQCAAADLGITGAYYALAETGSLVMLSSAEETRMISLLPPVHLAVVARDQILMNLDELLRILPNPDQLTSSMILITGPSRTADIEQILIRRVHGPGDLHVLIL
jgi:L-lactate dehydrogenase complex protein LldG